MQNQPPVVPSIPQSFQRALVGPDAAALQGRFGTHFAVLADRLQRLYGTLPGFEEWLHQLVQQLVSLHGERSAALRELDNQRYLNRRWFMDSNQVGYCAYVDRFGGDLQGVTRRIPHLRKLGVTYLHLLPFLRAREGDNDGGFAVADFDQVEPALGTMHDLEQLTAALRAEGISLCSDFVLNHVADTHAWAEAAKAGDADKLAYFCAMDSAQQAQDIASHLNQVFPETAPGNFTYSEALQKWIWTTFYPYQWDLNYANPQVFSAMLCAMVRLANHGIEVFRLDSTAYLWKRAGTTCMNQPEVHWILQAMRAAMDIVAPGVLLKAEAIVPTAELGAYLGSPDPHNGAPECHLAYHSTLMAGSWVALATGRTDMLRQVIDATPVPAWFASWMTYVRCHDDIGWNVLQPEAAQGPQDYSSLIRTAQILTGEHGGFGRGVAFQSSSPGKLHGTNGMAAALTGLSAAQTEMEKDAALRRLLLLYGVACCFGGMPLIYMGDELGQDNDPGYLNGPSRQADSRWIQRPHFSETAFAQLADARSMPARITGGLRRMLGIRRRLAELAADAPRRLLNCSNPAVLAMERCVTDTQDVSKERLLFIANFSSSVVALHVNTLVGPDGTTSWNDLLTGTSNDGRLILQPWEQVWLKPGDRPASGSFL